MKHGTHSHDDEGPWSAEAHSHGGPTLYVDAGRVCAEALVHAGIPDA